ATRSRFNGFGSARETVETVSPCVNRLTTPLKRGVNERIRRRHRVSDIAGRSRVQFTRASGSLKRRSIGVIVGLGILAIYLSGAGAKEIKLLNVSYDPTRELYQ